MIAVKKALEIVKSKTTSLGEKTTKPVEKSNTYRLCEDVFSPINMPPFRQSAMDGYAINLHDNLTYKLIGEVKAGDTIAPTLKQGEAVRIFTGAPVPNTANAVIMQEKVTVNGNGLTIEAQPSLEHNIRPLGEQVKKGDLALKRGTKLTPAAIGYLSALGIKEVSVLKKPSIAILTTGNELIAPGQPLSHGKIYESNSSMLLSALYGLKFYDVSTHKIEDDYNNTFSKLKELIEQNDLVIITGGISVGDYDFVGTALKSLNVEQCFYKVKQKPGKPLFFGKKDNTSVFALPGNPAAALTCFYVYVYTALQRITGEQITELPRIKVKSLSEFKKQGDRAQFLKAIYQNDGVSILEGQSSAMLQTFAVSNALVYIPEDLFHVKINDFVEVILLPV
ncbi:molybdopterin molybdotransferase MoeA [Snuella sedimenti]|uniref:Molybdopterin molybdenumtransferase n=1 Tax=Snuella sedimenti TaxID=2798802 RepID=A0A8J7LSG5_9FLAO|nr:gephyrin-like molybdotransferase Glp [Snuella sedimenti]MBJ6367266.1 molybdopterin molybdotransferase MoeA [Snuella sedimenti]